MNETAVFEQRQLITRVLFYLLGSILLGFGGIFVFCGLLSGLMGLFFLLASIFFIFGAACMRQGHARARSRAVVVDTTGIRLVINGRLRWGLPWTAIHAIGTRRKNGDRNVFTSQLLDMTNPGSGHKAIFFATDQELHVLRRGDDFGPEKTMRELFRLLVRCAVERNIPVEDGLGWGEGLELRPRGGLWERLHPGGYLIPPAGLDLAGYEGKWHPGNCRASPLAASVLSFGLAGFGIICLLFGFIPFGINPLAIFGLVLTPLGILLARSVDKGSKQRISFLGFNRQGLCIQDCQGIWTSLRWEQVRRCKLDTNTRWLAIETEAGNWNGLLDETVMLSICKAFTGATGRPAEAWSSGVEFLAPKPVRNLN